MTFASLITCSRICLIIPIIYLTSFGEVTYNFYALICFLLAGLTDYIDGYVARKSNTETALGALLDLLADKLLVCIVLVWIVFIYSLNDLIFPVLIILSRELIISSLREFIVKKLGENPVQVSYIAKSKTTLQFVAISFLIISPEMQILSQIAQILVWLAALVSIYSLLNYFEEYKTYF